MNDKQAHLIISDQLFNFPLPYECSLVMNLPAIWERKSAPRSAHTVGALELTNRQKLDVRRSLVDCANLAVPPVFLDTGLPINEDVSAGRARETDELTS